MFQTRSALFGPLTLELITFSDTQYHTTEQLRFYSGHTSNCVGQKKFTTVFLSLSPSAVNTANGTDSQLLSYICMGESTGKGFRVFPLSLLIYTRQNSLQYKRQACGFLSALFSVFTRQLCFS